MRLGQRLALVAGLLGWNVWNVWAFLSSPLKVIGSMELHPPFFLLLASVSIPATVAIGVASFWQQLRALSPRKRFNGLDDELRDAHDTIGIAEDFGLPLTGHHNVLTVQRKLNRLSIPTPPLDDHRRWRKFIVRVRSLAQTEDLKEARRLEEKR